MKSLAIIFVVLIAAYTGFWFYKAEEAKAVVANELAKVQSDSKNPYRIQHENLGVGGFPFSYEVKVPQFKMTSENEALKELAIKGNLYIGTNLWGTSYWISKDGNTEIVASKDNETQRFLETGDTKLELDVENPDRWQALLHPFSALPEIFTKKNYLAPGAALTLPNSYTDQAKKDNEMTLERIKGGSVHLKNFAIQSADQTNNKLLEMDKFDFDWTRKDTDKYWSFDVKGDIKGFWENEEAPRVLSKIHDSYAHLDYVGMHSAEDDKTDISFKMDAELPKDLSAFSLMQLPSMHFTVRSFEVNSEHSQMKFDSAFEIKDQDAAVKHIHFDWNASTDVDQKGYELAVAKLVNYVRTTIKQDPHSAEAQKWSLIMQCCEEDLKSLIPRYHELSPITAKMDIDAKINQDQNNYLLDIKAFNFDTKLYGLNSFGNANFSDLGINGEYVIEIKDFKKLIKDSVNYYNRALPLIAAMQDGTPETAPELATEQTEESINSFLRRISDQPQDNSDDLKITIRFPNADEVSIGTLDFEAFVAEWDRLQTQLSESQQNQVPSEEAAQVE